MAETQPILLVEPQGQLRFRGPFTEVVTSNINLTNISEHNVCYIVKTTAPKRYCVRPNEGILEPGSSVNVAAMLQPFYYDPTEKRLDKFMIQFAFAKDVGDGSLSSFSNRKPQNPDKIMDVKLKCVFEIPRPEIQPEVLLLLDDHFGKGKSDLQPEFRQSSETSILPENHQACSNYPENTLHDSTVPATSIIPSLETEITATVDSPNTTTYFDGDSDEIFLYECGLCRAEGKTKEAKKFCVNCQSNICDFCIRSHNRFGDLRKHEISDVMVAPIRHAKQEAGHGIVCSCSGNNNVEFYCETHDEVLCISCITVKHRKCNIVSVQQKSDAYSFAQVDSVLQKADDLRDEIARVETCRATHKKAYAGSKEKCKEEIRSFRKEINAWLDELEENTLKEVEHKKQEQSFILDLAVLSNMLKSLDTDYKMLQTAKNEGTKDKMFICTVKMCRSLKECRAALVDMKADNIPHLLSFERNQNLEHNIDIVKSLGVIKEII